jgi:amino-acid N-acetyltransferase
LLQALLERDIVPIIPPLGCDGEGKSYRLNSDAVAVEVARALRAVKLIYLTTISGIRDGEEFIHQLSVEEAESLLKRRKMELPTEASSKLEHAVRAAAGGVPRVHIIDGRVEQGLLAEVFSNEGIGTLVHANEYQAIRHAQKKDVRALHALIQTGVDNDELVRRSRAEIERQVGDFFIFEVDRNPAGCMAVHHYPDENKAELACLCVDPKYENQGIGAKLMNYAEAQARAAGVTELFCLSTQAFNYFMQKGGFRAGTPDDLPPARRERFDKSGRRSQVLAKKL